MQLVKKIASGSSIRTESVFKRTLVFIALAVLLITVGLLITLVVESLPSMRLLGLKYFWGKTWDPVSNVYGALPFLVGTLATSFLALLISIPFSYAIAIYLLEFKTKGWLH